MSTTKSSAVPSSSDVTTTTTIQIVSDHLVRVSVEFLEREFRICAILLTIQIPAFPECLVIFVSYGQRLFQIQRIGCQQRVRSIQQVLATHSHVRARVGSVCVCVDCDDQQ